MIVTDLIRAVCVAFVATGYLFGFLQAWMLLVTTLTISTVEAFRGPASAALTPKVLEKEMCIRDRLQIKQAILFIKDEKDFVECINSARSFLRLTVQTLPLT